MNQTKTGTTGDCDCVPGVPATDRHRLLAAERRRVTLDVLGTRPTPVRLEALAATVAAREPDTDGSDDEHVHRVATTLHHVHLPMMADVGVVDYDVDANRVDAFLLDPTA